MLRCGQPTSPARQLAASHIVPGLLWPGKIWALNGAKTAFLGGIWESERKSDTRNGVERQHGALRGWARAIRIVLRARAGSRRTVEFNTDPWCSELSSCAHFPLRLQ